MGALSKKTNKKGIVYTLVGLAVAAVSWVVYRFIAKKKELNQHQ